jgi:hypothetical protein
VRQRLELPTSYIREGGGAVRRRLELPISCIREGGGVVRRQLELPLLQMAIVARGEGSHCSNMHHLAHLYSGYSIVSSHRLSL